MTGADFEEGDMERRVQALERNFEKIDTKLDKLVDSLQVVVLRLTRIEAVLESKASSAEVADLRGVLESKASSADVAELRGMVKNLPNIVQMATLVFGNLVGAFAIARFGLPHP